VPHRTSPGNGRFKASATQNFGYLRALSFLEGFHLATAGSRLVPHTTSVIWEHPLASKDITWQRQDQGQCHTQLRLFESTLFPRRISPGNGRIKVVAHTTSVIWEHPRSSKDITWQRQVQGQYHIQLRLLEITLLPRRISPGDGRIKASATHNFGYLRSPSCLEWYHLAMAGSRLVPHTTSVTWEHPLASNDITWQRQVQGQCTHNFGYLRALSCLEWYHLATAGSRLVSHTTSVESTLFPRRISLGNGRFKANDTYNFGYLRSPSCLVGHHQATAGSRPMTQTTSVTKQF
jgi:hypothetical protein